MMLDRKQTHREGRFGFQTLESSYAGTKDSLR